MQGTVSEGPTTITTYTPPIATSVVVPTPDHDPAPPAIVSPQPNQPDLETPGIPPLTTVAPSTQPDEPAPLPVPTFTSIASNPPGNGAPYISTITIKDEITRTYKITTSTALILLVTETSTYTEIDTITQNHPYVDHQVFTTSVPISTYTTASSRGQGYFNITDLDDYYREFVTTQYSTYETTYDLVRERYEITYLTRVLEKVITSTLIVWGNQLTDSYMVDVGYYTTETTITPGTYVTTVMPTNPVFPISKSTPTVTITVTSTTTTLSTSSDICATIFAQNGYNNDASGYTVEIYSGNAQKQLAPSIYYIGFLFPLFI